MKSTDEPIRILHVLGKMNGGGVESMVMTYYRFIDKRKIQFDFIVDNDSKYVPSEEIKSLGGQIYFVSPYQKLNNYNRELREILDINSYTIIHSHINSLSIFPLNVAKKANVPVRIAHSHSTSAPGEYKKNIMKHLLRPFSRMYPTHFCSCSVGAGQWLFGRRIYDNDRLTIINNGIDLTKFQFDDLDRKEIRRVLGIDNKYVIGHTGRLCFQKNQEFLLHMLKYILTVKKDYVLLLIGDGPDRTKLTKLAKSLNITDSVIIIGNKEDVKRYYSAMDLFVFPSKYEGFGISAIEAQASGIPVFISENVPIEVLLSTDSKILPLTSGVKAWANEILNAELNLQRHRTLMRNDYDIKNNVVQLEDYYLKLNNESSGVK